MFHLSAPLFLLDSFLNLKSKTIKIYNNNNNNNTLDKKAKKQKKQKMQGHILPRPPPGVRKKRQGGYPRPSTSIPKKGLVTPRKASKFARNVKHPLAGDEKGLYFAVNTDVGSEESTLMENAIFGPVRRGGGSGNNKIYYTESPTRPTESDIQLGADQVAYGALSSVMGGSGTSSVPTEWTQGYAVPRKKETRNEGYRMAEGGWYTDPVNTELIGTMYERVVTQASGLSRTAAAKSMQKAYIKAAAYQQGVVSHAARQRFDFRPVGRSSEASSSSLPWLSSIEYESASAALRPMWSILDLTKIDGSDVIMSSKSEFEIIKLLQKMGESHEDKTAFDFLSNELRNKAVNAILEQKQVLSHLRSQSVRLVMQASNLDKHKTELLRAQIGPIIYSPEGTNSASYSPHYLVKSMFFGNQHASVQQSVEQATESDPIRAMFRPGARSLFNTPMFAYSLDRVLVSDKIPGSRTELEAMPVGIRIRIPPAPKGYTRGNVVILFRVAPGLADDITDTMAMFVASIPDEGTFRLDQDPDDVVRVVSEYQASIVLYMSPEIKEGEQQQQQQQQQLPSIHTEPDCGDGMNESARGQKPVEGIFSYGDGDESEAGDISSTLEWKACYDILRLEYCSGNGGILHPVNNRVFRKRMEEIFLCSRTSRQGGPTSLAPRVEVFVELRTDQNALDVARKSRQMFYQRRYVSGAKIYTGFMPPPNISVYRRFDLRFKTDVKTMMNLPVANLHPIQEVTLPTMAEKLFFEMSQEEYERQMAEAERYLEDVSEEQVREVEVEGSEMGIVEEEYQIGDITGIEDIEFTDISSSFPNKDPIKEDDFDKPASSSIDIINDLPQSTIVQEEEEEEEEQEQEQEQESTTNLNVSGSVFTGNTIVIDDDSNDYEEYNNEIQKQKSNNPDPTRTVMVDEETGETKVISNNNNKYDDSHMNLDYEEEEEEEESGMVSAAEEDAKAWD